MKTRFTLIRNLMIIALAAQAGAAVAEAGEKTYLGVFSGYYGKYYAIADVLSHKTVYFDPKNLGLSQEALDSLSFKVVKATGAPVGENDEVLITDLAQYQASWKELISCENSDFVIDQDAQHPELLQLVIRRNRDAIEYARSNDLGGRVYDQGNTLIANDLELTDLNPAQSDSWRTQLKIDSRGAGTLTWRGGANDSYPFGRSFHWTFYNCTVK